MGSLSKSPDAVHYESMTRPIYWLLAYVAFIVYGMLVPLDFHPHSLTWAWARFQEISMLPVGIESRADAIANGVLFVPVGFLSAIVLAGGRHGAGMLWTRVTALGFSCCLAVTIEFLQIFFPPRTVSLNDILSECLGSVVGVLIAARGTTWFRQLIGRRLDDPARYINLALQFYLFLFVAYSLYPYDFVLSADELAIRANSVNWGWWQAAISTRGSRLWSLLHTTIEAAAVLPIGLLLARRPARTGRAWSAFFLGLLLGLLIEVAQFFLYSGVSQGLSVLARAIGCWLGALLWERRAAWTEIRVAATARRLALLLAPIYLTTVLAVNGWFTRPRQGAASAMVALAEVHFVPFYYHYFTSEALALVSVVSVALQYAPVGVFVWAFDRSPLRAASMAFGLALAVEVGRLFLVGAHADPTNLLVAAGGAWLAAALAYRFARLLREEASDTVPQRLPAAPVAAKQQRVAPAATTSGTVACTAHRPTATGLVTMLLAVVAAAFWLASFPVYAGVLAVFLMGVMFFAWRWPVLLVALLPATLPLLDLAPWSGRFYLDEFDVFLALSLALGYARVAPAPRGYDRDALFQGIIALVALSYIIGTLRGLLPWQGLDVNSLTNYYSPYNALRIAKGAFWAFLLFGLLRRLEAAGRTTGRSFTWGMVIGLSGTVGVICWERLTFPGLLNFASDYRVTGPFSQLHNGGADMEVFLIAALPFLVLLLLQIRSWLVRLAGVAVLIGATYALMVTFSRGAYAAFVLAVAIVVLASFRETLARRAVTARQRLAAMAFSMVALAVMLVVAVPVFLGQFAQARLSISGDDLGVRRNHWADALRMRDPDGMAALLGVGVGRYPEMHYWRSRENNRSATYRLVNEEGETFLRLTAGNPIFLEQGVAVSPNDNYLLSLDLRAHQPGARIGVSICEKWLFASYNCVSTTFGSETEVNTWVHFEKSVASGEVGSGHWYSRRPVRLALHNAGGEFPVDVDNVSLVAPDGRQLVANGNFSHALDHWFFSADDHKPWHIFSLPVGILFDQGWLGVVSLGLLAALALGRATRAAWRGNVYAGAVLASLTGVMVLGLFNSVVDSPRILLLVLLLARFGAKASDASQLMDSRIAPPANARSFRNSRNSS